MKISKPFNPLLLLTIRRKLKAAKNAFTLIELLLVISIIAILAAIILVLIRSPQEAARDSRRQSDLSQIRKSLQAYYLANNSYPATDSDGISLEDDIENITFTQAMKGSGYMSVIPKDPKYTTSTGEYTYKYIATTSNAYTLCAKSEAKGDYFCASQASIGISQTASAPVFGVWGGGSGGGFACGDAVTFTYNGSSVTYNSTSSVNGECWLDRNLGATQVAAAYNDSAAYGDLFQWGRLDDGHQTRTSGTTTVISSVDDPGHSNFITINASPNDWRFPQNNNLWQGASDANNNPCPVGWRVPTIEEWAIEIESWTLDNYIGAINSPLRLPPAGYKDKNSGNIGTYELGTFGIYWSGDTSSMKSSNIQFGHNWSIVDDSSERAHGFSVRCIKD